ncbi:MAG: LCP family protein [Candidatus Peregrinibacteria bacterium]
MKKIRLTIPLIASIVIIIALCVGIVKAISSVNMNVFLKLAGDELQTDAFGHTNFLLLGTAGKNNDGADLTDTIIVASLDDEDKTLTMLSIPRDLYVKDEEVGNSKINEIYLNAKKYFDSSAEGVEYLKKKIEEIMGIPIHYWAKVNFDGFKELVDTLGGIDIEVENAIYDPYYPKDGTYNYETFQIPAGLHHMDGETALKYARSRKTTSDFDRAQRQQQIIYAIKEKALQTEVILSQEKIKELLNTLKSNVETNIKIREILTMGAIAGEYSQENISHRLIHDDPTQCGGFLYTPMREYYGGMFVLIPAGGEEFLHMYADMNFDYPLIAKEVARIHILNGTKTGGVAGEAKQILQRFCFEINRFGNARNTDLEQTTYYYMQKYDEKGDPIDSRPVSLDFLEKLIPGIESTEIPQDYIDKGYFDQTDIILEIGGDYVNSDNYIDDPFYSLPAVAAPAVPAAPEASPETTPAETSQNSQ